MQNGIQRQTSIREKLKSSICCFTGMVHDPLEHAEGGFYNKLRIPRTPISPAGSTPSLWFKSNSHNGNSKSPMGNGELGGGETVPRVRGRSLRSRVGRKLHYHRQSQSADFSYDPSSYALNFESENTAEEVPFRNFSSRLPASPPPMKYSDEIAGCS